MKNLFLKLFLNLFSHIPPRIAYFVADILYFFQNHLIHYRRKVILKNLQNAFPEKSNTELQLLYQEFNRHLCDYIIESLIFSRLSWDYLNKRTRFSNFKILDKYYQKQNILFLAGHIFNWEYATLFAHHLKMRNKFAVYKASKNIVIDEFIKKSRSRFGITALTMSQSVKKFIESENDGNSAFLMVADQTPARPKIRYDLKFLHQDTPVYNGFDQLIRKFNYAVIYVDIQKIKRGEYHFTLKELKPKNGTWQANESVDAFFKALENNIKNDPANWLWSHRRWKHQKGRDF
ncbi:lipid A biosynthesis lauroyl acyltransferase [Candidatus Ornithobacterium hominis]|uniref:Lipid A biosynthesis lauroyl acyltransferase n=1 Tax=Candidatus Ornithobacterium hominis TaxID=2497989 RepID=A0A383TY73_9FLAO|nr:lysophospholipid acyltransferase family protein [Candidatus Ornithobacterium hominis]MCT7903938.1 lysophospholipid acyltransferase family protein [Candidatus Ornithobacterium hominis]SZD72525.1 lipid A biosynthesis lauroyl acyltransferase [Candidatus Ornithobacterium hominis]